MILLLVLLTPAGTAAFWLIAAALVALSAMHAAYWLLTHPVNNFWLKGFKLRGIGAGFFSFDPLNRAGDAGTPEWTAPRDRWELSHVVRAVLGLLSLICSSRQLQLEAKYRCKRGRVVERPCNRSNGRLAMQR